MTDILVPALYKMQQEGKLLTNLLPVVGSYALGTGRYSHEHWVAGHGTIRPCDVVQVTTSNEEMENHERGKNSTTTRTTITTTRQSMMAPRELINSTKWYGFKPSRTKRVLQNKHLRLQEYFLLSGYLFRLHVLYPQQGPPPSDSWVWTWVSFANGLTRPSLYLDGFRCTVLTIFSFSHTFRFSCTRSSQTASCGKTLWENTEESFLL
jgi:hypothetical protein